MFGYYWSPKARWDRQQIVWLVVLYLNLVGLAAILSEAALGPRLGNLRVMT